MVNFLAMVLAGIFIFLFLGGFMFVSSVLFPFDISWIIVIPFSFLWYHLVS